MTLAHRRTPRARRSARLLVAALVVALVGGAALVSAAPATAASTYVVGGSITYAVPGSTAPTTRVRLYPVTGSQPASAGAYTTTSSRGSWSVAGVAPGRYRILFEATSSDGQANAPVWYGGTPFEDAATVVQVSGDVNGLTVSQPAAGSISGTVTGPMVPSALQAYLLNPSTGLFERAVGYGSATGSGTGGYTIRGLAAGEYVVRFADRTGDLPRFSTQYYRGADSLWDSQTVTVAAGQPVTGIDGTVSTWGWYSGRISGSDRFATSAEVSSAFNSAGTTTGSGPVVHIASGTNFPDALSASAASAAVGGPLLLTLPGALPSAIRSELMRLKPKAIVVVGGSASISDGVYEQLATLTPTISRVSGGDRFATSRAVMADAFGSGPVTSVFVATGTNFPDALVAGSAAGYQYGPLLLVNGGAAHLDSASAAAIRALTPSRIYVVGGLNSISRGVQSDLEELGAPQVLRLAGADRFGTAQAVNAAVFPFADEAFVASAYGFPDALSISAAAGMVGSPLLLAPPDCIPYGEVADSTARGVSTYWAVGGSSVLSDAVTQLNVCPGGAATNAASGSLGEVRPAPQAADGSGLGPSGAEHGGR